jgi:MFS family permease
MTKPASPYFSRAVLIFIMARMLERFTTNIYVAILPLITIALMVSHQLVQMSMVVYLIFSGISQLLCGFGDRYHKRWLLLGSAILVFLGSSLIVVFHDANFLIMGRAIQALGAACAPVIGNAYLSDVSLKLEKQFDNRVTIKIFSWMGMLVTWLPALAMYLGSVMERYYGWQSSFIVLMLLSAIIFCIFFWAENEIKLPTEDKTYVLKNYLQLLKNKDFLVRSFSFSILVCGITAYYLLSVFIYHHTFKLSAHTIGLLAFLQVGSYLLGRLTSPILYSRFGEKILLWTGIHIALISALTMFLLCYLLPPHLSSILWPFAVYSLATGMLAPCVNVGIMRVIPNTSSSAEGLFNLMITVLNVIIGLIATQLSISYGLDFSILLVIQSLIAWCILFFYL